MVEQALSKMVRLSNHSDREDRSDRFLTDELNLIKAFSQYLTIGRSLYSTCDQAVLIAFTCEEGQKVEKKGRYSGDHESFQVFFFHVCVEWRFFSQIFCYAIMSSSTV